MSVFPTCFVEYMDPDVGRDLVRVYEHNGLSCSLPDGTTCCGAPWLHSGNVDRFALVARDNVAALAAVPGIWRTQTSDPAWTSGFLGFARIAQLYDVLPAAGLLLLGLLALLLPSGRRVLAAAAPLAVFTALAAVVVAILEWGGPIPAILHQGPYAVVILLVGLCALAVTALPWPLASAVAAASAAWFAVSWIPGLGFHPGSGWSSEPLLIAAGLVLAALCVVDDYRHRRGLPVADVITPEREPVG